MNNTSNEATNLAQSLNPESAQACSGNNQRRPNSNYSKRGRGGYHNQNQPRSYQKCRQSNQKQQKNRSSDENESTDDLPDTNSTIVSNDQKNKIYNRRKLISVSSTNTNEVSCICCLHELYTFVYYACSHYVCLNCAVKMRVLCQKLDCPVCRRESKNVLCVKSEIESSRFDKEFGRCEKSMNHIENDAGIYFEDSMISKEYEETLSNRCDICPATMSPFRTFQELDYHIRKVHRRFYCDLCLDNLKLFPYERKHYTREELASHKRHGDKDDYSFKGHPLCEYCDQRFFDRDELYRHCRRDHYFCHFCDSDGIEEYYNDYMQLREHFLKSHFLCELDGCSANAAQTHEYVVFRSELDFQAHKKQKHAKNKSESKSFGKLNIEFTLSNSARDRYRRPNRRYNNQPDSDADEMESSQAHHSKHRNQSKISTTEIDPNVLRMSREQFERDEEERKKQEKIQKLKQQYEKHEQQETKHSELIAVEEPTTSTAISQVPQVETQSTWRNLIGSGATPKINKETEFPSLSSGGSLSLANIGASISSKSNAWKPKNEPAKVVQHPESNLQDLKTLLAKTSLTDVKKSPEQEASVSTQKKAKKKKEKVKQPEQISTEPPPGFAANPKIQGPPPGFETKPPENGFLKPEKYEQRNQDLKSRLFLLFGHYNQEEFEKFKTFSIEFKNSILNAEDYLIKCQKLLDLPVSSDAYSNKKNQDHKEEHLKFFELVQEMLVLLPDVKKQSELYEAFSKFIDMFAKSETQSKGSSGNFKWLEANKSSFSVCNKLQKCSHCEQYFLNSEFNFHQMEHHSKELIVSEKIKEEDFPKLGVPGSSGAPWSMQIRPNLMEKQKKQEQEVVEDFPTLGSTLVNTENRFSALPTSSLFSNPSSHLSLVNKKKHRLLK